MASRDARAPTRGVWPRARRLVRVGTVWLPVTLAGCAGLAELDLAPSLTLLGHESDVVSIAFSADGERIYSADATGTIRDWAVGSGRPISIVRPAEGATRIVLSARGDRAFAARDNQMLVIDMRQRALLTSFDVGPRTTAFQTADIAISPFGGTGLVLARNGRLAVWNLWDAASVELSPGGLAATDRPRLLALSHNASLAMTASPRDATVGIWDTVAGSLLNTFEADPAGTRLIAFMPGDERAVTVGPDDIVRIWDVATGNRLAALADGRARGISAIAVWPDGNMLVTGHTDGSLVFWSEQTGAAVARRAAHGGWVQAIAVSPDGRTIISGGPDDVVKVWDTTTGEIATAIAASNQGFFARFR